MWNTPGTSRECSREILYSTDGLCDGTEICQYTELDAKLGFELHHFNPTNPRRSNYDLHHNPKPNCNDDNWYWVPNIALMMSQFITVITAEHTRTCSGNDEERATETIRCTLLWKIPSNLLTCLSTLVQLTSKTRPLKFNSILCTGRLHTNLQTFFFSFPSLFDYTLYTINNQMQRKRYRAVQKRQSNYAKFDSVEYTSSLKKRKIEVPDDDAHYCDKTEKPHDRVQHRNLDPPCRTYGDWWQDCLLQIASETFAHTPQRLFFCSRSQDCSEIVTN